MIKFEIIKHTAQDINGRTEWIATVAHSETWSDGDLKCRFLRVWLLPA